MKWNDCFAERTKFMKRGAVRELLKLTSRPEIISFAGGLPAAEFFPADRVQEALTAVLRRAGGSCLQYAETEGIAGLRDWIAARFSRGPLKVTRENVLITSGAQQALDLLGRILLDPGDRVALESPTYLALLSAWRPLGVEFQPVPSDREGLRMDLLEDLLKNRPPKIIYLVPNFQNPQGTTLARDRRERLALLLRGRQIPLVEDNPYGDLRYDGEPLPDVIESGLAEGAGGPLQSPVIHVGTFSKVLMPGLRVGWAIADSEVIEKLVQAKQAADLHTATLSQHLVLELVNRGFLEEFIPVLRETYRERRDLMLAALDRCFPAGVSWTRPQGGMFLLVTLPASMDAGALLPRAIAQGVAFVPGEEFHPDGRGRNTLRLNFSNARPDQIDTGIERLARLVNGG
jgi:2-aminoadipate transaminase